MSTSTAAAEAVAGASIWGGRRSSSSDVEETKEAPWKNVPSLVRVSSSLLQKAIAAKDLCWGRHFGSSWNNNMDVRMEEDFCLYSTMELG